MTDKEYIERNSLLDEVKQIEGAFARPLIIRKIEEAKVEDVVEVKHGKWTLETDEEMPNPMFKLVICSVCNEKTGHTFKYCPHCGAKMDLKEGALNDN